MAGHTMFMDWKHQHSDDTLSKLMHRLNNFYKVPARSFMDVDRTIIKFIWKGTILKQF